jgi:glycerate dehydrogenase
MKNIVILQPLGVAPAQLAELRKLGNVTYHHRACKDAAEWLALTKNADIVLTNINGIKDAWRQVHNLFITLSFVGYGFMDLDILKKHNVIVANSPGCNQVAVTEWIVAMLLNYSRHLLQSSGMTEQDPTPPLGISLYGKSVCVIGKGNIGQRSGKALEALGMRVTYYTRHDDLTEKIKDADYIVDCLSSNPTTQHFYGDDFFQKTKDGVVFLSISPNETQDIDSIERHLTTGKITHFITDNASSLLYDTSDAAYKRFAANPRVTVTPHMASYADNTAETANAICIENIRAYLAGEPKNLIYKL